MSEAIGKPGFYFKRPISGDDVPPEEIEEALEVSIAEIQRLLVEAITFYVRMKDARLKEGDHFMDFSIVTSEGYDRTGPSVIEVEEA